MKASSVSTIGPTASELFSCFNDFAFVNNPMEHVTFFRPCIFLRASIHDESLRLRVARRAMRISTPSPLLPPLTGQGCSLTSCRIHPVHQLRQVAGSFHHSHSGHRPS